MPLKLAIRLDESFPGHTQKKFQCPSCSKKRFVRFYDFTKDEFLPEQYGRCDRQEHCGYYLSPFSENSEFVVDKSKLQKIEVPEFPIKYVDTNIVKASLSSYHTNTFVQFLINLVGEQLAMEAVFKFMIGTAKNNGTVFWQIDQFKKPRTAAKIHYLPDGHRNKDLSVKRLFLIDDHYKPCLFGEHQIADAPKNAIFCVVESEKTAILGNLYIKTLKNRPVVWLACSGSNGLTFDKIQCLRGRDVLLCPDFSFHARATWGLLPMRKKLKEVKGKIIMSIDESGEVVDYESAKDRFISLKCNVSFFDPCPEVNDGSDLADLLIGEKPPEPDPEPKKETPLIMPNVSSMMIGKKDDQDFDFKSITGTHNFRFKVQDSMIITEMNNLALQKSLDQYMNSNENIVALINRFDLGGNASIKSIK